jgi:hypothetical protein
MFFIIQLTEGRKWRTFLKVEDFSYFRITNMSSLRPVNVTQGHLITPHVLLKNRPLKEAFEDGIWGERLTRGGRLEVVRGLLRIF